MESSTRTRKLLEISSVEKLDPSEEGYELSEGYVFEVNGSLMNVAHGISVFISELDNQLESGAGETFMTLLTEYYQNNINKEVN